MHPFLILGIGMVLILGAIIGLRLNAFLALIGAAIVVSFLAPGDPVLRLTRVAEAFGKTAGNVGLSIAFAAVIGAAMTESGAADRIIQTFLRAFGEKRDAAALSATAFVISLPVFFDTVFFLLAPLARSMYARTNRNYLRYLLAMCGSAVATHTLVPPHPGPLAIASTLNIDVGLMIIMGILVAVPGALAGYAFASWADTRVHVAPPPALMAEIADSSRELPSTAAAFLPVLLPVTLIAAGTIVDGLRVWLPAQESTWSQIRPVTSVIGNPSMALFISAIISIVLFVRHLKASRDQVATMVERSLMGSGVVILIVGAGGAFGAMLQAARIGPAIQALVPVEGAGKGLLLLAFLVTGIIRTAQGSSTVAMIATSSIMAAMIKGLQLPFHPVYIGLSISAGSLLGSWMNDAGFWLFCRIGGATEVDTFRSWSPLLMIVACTSMATTLILATLLPLR